MAWCPTDMLSPSPVQTAKYPGYPTRSGKPPPSPSRMGVHLLLAAVQHREIPIARRCQDGYPSQSARNLNCPSIGLDQSKCWQPTLSLRREPGRRSVTLQASGERYATHHGWVAVPNLTCVLYDWLVRACVLKTVSMFRMVCSCCTTVCIY